MSLVSLVTGFAATEGAECTADKSKLLGILPRWNAFLPMQLSPPTVEHPAGQCNVVAVDFMHSPEKALLVGLALIDMLLVLSGVIAFIFILYGGFQYIISQGQPENTKKALDTIKNALIGLVIAAVASQLVTFIGHKIGT